MSKTLALLALSLPLTVMAHSINWKSKNSFRLINHESAAADFKIQKSQSALEFITSRFTNRDQHPTPPIDHTFLSKDTKTLRRFPKEYIFPTAHKAVANIDGLQGSCVWNYQQTIKEIDCSAEFEFDAITQFGEGDPTLSVRSVATGQTFRAKATIRDRLILGIGDSYASGEGNPDIPAKISPTGTQLLAQSNRNSITTGRWTQKDKIWVEQYARWLDQQCHRSFLSQHVLASMRLASANPKETVTLLPLACSGAEILDGLLTPQKAPPGGGESVFDSQINTAVSHLCRSEKLRASRKLFYRGYTGSGIRRPEYASLYRCEGEMRKPDAVLLSIGGNDVGFAPSIAWATMPSGHRNLAGLLSVNITNKAIDPVCPKYTGQSICQKNKPVGRDRIKYWLPDYYKWLAQELQDSGLVNNPGSVFLTAYPNPSYIEDGQTFCDKDRSRDLSEQARSMLPRVFTTSKWDIGITKEEIEDLNTGLITPLFHAMNNAATEHGWNFVSDHIAEMKKHGICAGYSRTEAKTPIYPHIRNGVWYPENPSTILAYDLNRQRWFRNTNDSVLFQAQKTGRSINGAFHPDFRAHALIADHLYAKILKYWDQNNDSFSGAE